MGNRHCGYVIEVKKLKPHPNADKLQLLEAFGTETCVPLDVKMGDIGIYFPTDLQLSEEFCVANDLLEKKDENGNKIGGYLHPTKRNVKCIRLRGEKSDGTYLPITCLDYLNLAEMPKVGDTIDVLDGHEICRKYIPTVPAKSAGNGSVKTKKKENIFPYFKEHIDTPQLRFNLDHYKKGDIICLTEKVHGTSSRNGYCLYEKEEKNIFQKFFKLKGKIKTGYENVTGTRRTIINNNNNNNLGYYGTHGFRLKWADHFKNKLHPGEEVFGEIAGFYEVNAPIMAQCNNKKTNDKEFIKKYGDTTTFSYGCDPSGIEKPLNRFFIYRMTYTSPEGYIIEYPWELVKLRAEQMGVEVVPELETFIYTTEEDFLNRINKYMDISSTLDPTHIMEGVVIRKINSNTFDVSKEKCFSFKVIEGIVKENAEKPDMEEQEEV